MPTSAQTTQRAPTPTLRSDEFFINKAIGWSLRNYSRTNLVWVINFIIKYRTLMNKLSIKEASKYL